MTKEIKSFAVEIKSFAVANYILDCLKEDRIFITNLELQKIMFVANILLLSLHNEKLFEEEIEVLSSMPIIPSVFREFKSCGKNKIFESRAYIQIEPYSTQLYLPEISQEEEENKAKSILIACIVFKEKPSVINILYQKPETIESYISFISTLILGEL